MNAQRLLARLLVGIGYGLIGGSLSLMMVSLAKAASGADRARLGNTIIPNGSVVPEFSAGSVTFREGNGNTTRIGHTWDAQPSRQTRLNENYRVQVGGNEIDWTRRTGVPPAAISRAAAIALKTLAPVAVGIELWDLFKDIGVTPDGGGGLLADPGAGEQTQTTYCTSSYSAWPSKVHSQCGATPTAAAMAWAAVENALPDGVFPWGNAQVRVGSCTSTQCAMERRITPNPFVAWDYLGIGESSAGICPASIDASNPANNIPEGAPKMPNGKCQTARYNHQPILPDVAGDRLEAEAPPDGETLRRLAEDVLNRDVPIQGITPQSGTGPTSVPGTPKVTTTQNPDGSTVTTTKTPTTHYTYNGDTVNYTITTVTVTNNAGDITTVTEGTTPEETDQCKNAPDSLGCAKMGAPGTEAPQWQTRDVIFAPEDLGFSGACPSPESWDVFGMTLTWGYEPICDIAPFIRFALLAFAGIGAISIVIRETNS